MPKKSPQEVTLFLVEDDDVDAMTIERALKKLKIANPMIRARDGIEALEMLRANTVPKPYVTLLDLKMPRMNGIEFMNAVRIDPDLKDMVIFILTSSHEQKDLEAAYSQYAAGYFLKESAGDGLLNIANMLKGYWSVVCLPK